MEVRNAVGGFSVRQDPLQGRTAHTKCGTYLLGPSLAAALLGIRRVLARQGWAGETSGLFEHPAGMCSSCSMRAGQRSSALLKGFFRSLIGC